MEIPELLVRGTRGVVKILGLKTKESVPHQNVWAALTEGRTQESVPLNYALAEETSTVFPLRKKKVLRQTDFTDEDYVPPGILKQNWVTKHKHVVPSVVVAFFDLEWQDENWTDREASCAKVINELRSAMNGRHTRLVAVLMQESPLPDGDPLVEERAVSLRNACHLKTRSSLFALPSKDVGLKDMVVRLESAFFELSNKYYEQAETHVKTQMEALNHSTETVMVVRYWIKCGMFSELRQQRQLALKSYQHAYTLLKESKAPGVSLHEVKSVAGLIMAKICQIQFDLQTPVDALKSFREHMSSFGSREGKKDQMFRHYGWRAEQNFYFAVAFADAVSHGLAALQTEHPGFYFFRVATNTGLQREACVEALATLVDGVTAESTPPDFFGQFAITLEGLDADATPSSPTELETLKLAVWERSRPHASTMVDMCERALAQFHAVHMGGSDAEAGKTAAQRVQIERTSNLIKCTCAQELFRLGEYARALEMVQSAILRHRREQWHDLLADTLFFAYRAAYRAGNAHMLAACALELSSDACNARPSVLEHCTAGESDRSAVFANLERVLQGVTPLPPLARDGENADWAHAAAAQPPGPMLMDDLRHVIDCKISFEHKSVAADHDLCLVVLLRSRLKAPVTLHRLRPVFAEEGYDDAAAMHVDAALATGGLVLEPHRTHVVKLLLLPCRTDAHTVTCAALSASLGGSESSVTLTWNFPDVDTTAPSSALYVDNALSADLLTSLPWKAVPAMSSVAVKQLASRVVLSYGHQRPAMVGEMYALDVCVTSEETVNMTDVSLVVKVLEDGDGAPSTIGTVAVAAAEDEEPSAETRTELDCIPPGKSESKQFVLQFRARCNVSVEVLLQYCTETTTSSGLVKVWQHSKQYEEALSVVSPVRSHFSFETLERVPLSSALLPALVDTPEAIDGGTAANPKAKLVSRTEPFLLQWRIASNVAWPIEIVSARLQLSKDGATDAESGGGDGAGVYPYARSDAAFTSIANTTLGPQEQLSAVACMHLGASLAPRVDLGWLHIVVRRLGATARSTTSTHALPCIMVDEPGVSLHAQVAPIGFLRQPMQVTYTLKNHTSTVQDITFQVDKSRAMIFSGYQRLSVKILPGAMDADGNAAAAVKDITYNVLPLVGGHVALPAVQATVQRTGEVLTHVLGPTSVFIRRADVVQPVVPTTKGPATEAPETADAVEEVGAVVEKTGEASENADVAVAKDTGISPGPDTGNGGVVVAGDADMSTAATAVPPENGDESEPALSVTVQPEPVSIENADVEHNGSVSQPLENSDSEAAKNSKSEAPETSESGPSQNSESEVTDNSAGNIDDADSTGGEGVSGADASAEAGSVVLVQKSAGTSDSTV
eukprot:m.788348 g.788348  ORF g.788348 m.788348 type:complete len:1358 (-) comp23316_c0_seq8:298-4371(-)